MGAETDSNSLCRCVTCARGRAGRARGCQAAQRPRRARSGPRTAGRRDDRGEAHAGARSGPAARRTWQQTSAKVTSLSSPSALACEPWVLADSCSGSTLCHRGDCPGAGSGGSRGAAAGRRARRGHGGATAGTARAPAPAARLPSTDLLDHHWRRAVALVHGLDHGSPGLRRRAAPHRSPPACAAPRPSRPVLLVRTRSANLRGSSGANKVRGPVLSAVGETGARMAGS